LINNALDLGRLEAGRADLEVLPFECKDLAGNLEAALAVPAVQKGNRFRVLVDPRIPRLTGDPTRISQVLTNLAANAIKFTKMGQVTVRIVLVQRDENSACVSFAVRDTGIGYGLPRNWRSSLSPTRRPNRQIRSSYGGTGLGLAITRSILKLLNSELLVASTPGRGTEFSFTLNLPVAQAAEQKPRIGSISMPALRVLIAEDNDINSIVLERILQSWAVKFQFARDGKEALQAAREREFDLVLMDVQMPVLDGIEATRQLRQLNTAPACVRHHRGHIRGHRRVSTECRHERSATKTFPPGSTAFHPGRNSLKKKSKQGERMKVLIVDDSTMIRLALAKWLSVSGSEIVAEARNGREALELYRRHTPDLVTLDITMPEMDGLATLDEIMKINPQAKVIIVSALTSQETTLSALKRGARTYVRKPFTAEELAEAVREAAG
jgi:CheY-like chemotaxis protein